ncbi:hypothetical protein [Microbacterium oleivorans]|uniref:hypothetical protein n=1 Tax=Microbacterium oleivorans TaxID=273677 RepID=UPI0020409342|nr:hypothetical protein [Microbacterium oleivorans]MCM3697513.1 hypothetical protein [Microbacterium oleivorans]
MTGQDGLQAGSERVSLRSLLGASADPGFTLALPTGWVRREANEAEREALDDQVRTRLRDAHRPDLYAIIQPLLSDAFARMADASVLAFFAPAAGDDDALAIPASLVASVRTPMSPGDTLDPLVQALIRQEGATPLLGDKRFLRLERETRQEFQDAPVRVTQIVYLTPIPGTGRRRGLQLTGAVIRPDDAPADDRPNVMMKTLLDLCVSSLTWQLEPAAV